MKLRIFGFRVQFWLFYFRIMCNAWFGGEYSFYSKNPIKVFKSLKETALMNRKGFERQSSVCKECEECEECEE